MSDGGTDTDSGTVEEPLGDTETLVEESLGETRTRDEVSEAVEAERDAHDDEESEE